MNRIDAPAQRVEIHLGGEWRDITTAVEGFAQPRWRIERKTGVLTADKLIVRAVVPLLNELGITARQLLDRHPNLLLRLFFHDARSGVVPSGTPVFIGLVKEIGRLTKLKAGDCLELVALDLLEASNSRQPFGTFLLSPEPARYDEVIRGLAMQEGLSVGDLHAPGLTTETPYITHHPRPGGADATVQVRGLAWWPVHGILVCGIYDNIWGYSPSTGESYELATAPFIDTERQIEQVWIDGTDVYGVSLPTAEAVPMAKGRIVKADLSGFNPLNPSPPVNYAVMGEYKLWNAGMARILSTYATWREKKIAGVGDKFFYSGQAIGLAGPEEDEFGYGPVVFQAEFSSGGFTYTYQARVRDFYRTIVDPHPQPEWASENPMMYGRNLYLPEMTAVGIEHTESDKRPAEVVAYRMPGPLAYYIPRSVPVGENWVYDLGSYAPHAEKVSKLPCTLPAGYYAFISHGARIADFDASSTIEYVSAFQISFARAQRRPSVAHLTGDEVITAEDTVDVDSLDDPLGPLASKSADEFERLYYRELDSGAKQGVLFTPARSHSMRLARVSDAEVLVAAAQEAGLLGAYNRQEPLTQLLLGRVKETGGVWTYSTLATLADDGKDPHEIFHYRPTCLARLGNIAYVGYTRTSQRFRDLEGAPVYRAYSTWDIDGFNYRLGYSVIEVSSYLLDEVKKGDRIRLWYKDLPYAALPRTVLDVEWFEGRLTRITVGPPLDCSDGNPDPSRRKIELIPDTASTKGVEEYDARYADPEKGGFAWGAPTLQKEAEARRTETYLRPFNLTTKVWGEPIDTSLEAITEEITAEDDPENQRATIELSNSFPDTTTIEVKLGESPVPFTVDTDRLYETGECILRLPQRYAGLEFSVSYSHWDVSRQFTEATAVGETLYYTRGKELKSYTGEVRSHGEVHYKASGTASQLVCPALVAPPTIYGVAEGGGNYIYQLSTKHSLHIGDRSGWEGKGLASCLAEVALALGCVFWVDGSGLIHFVPRGWRRKQVTIAPEEVLDYTEPGAWQRAAPSVTVSWPGGEETAGMLSSNRLSDNESFSAPLITSAGWANLLASHLFRAKSSGNRAEVVLAGLRMDLEMGDGVKIGLAGMVSSNDKTGTLVGLEPQLDFGRAQTRITLELEG